MKERLGLPYRTPEGDDIAHVEAWFDNLCEDMQSMLTPLVNRRQEKHAARWATVRRWYWWLSIATTLISFGLYDFLSPRGRYYCMWVFAVGFAPIAIRWVKENQDERRAREADKPQCPTCHRPL